MMVLHHMHSNISSRVTVLLQKKQSLNLTCLKISWSAWRFGKEFVILHKWIVTRTSVGPIECSHPVRFIRCPAQPAPRLYFADCDMGKMFMSQCRGWRRRVNWVHAAQLTVTFDSSCAIWFFLNFGRTISGEVEEDSQPPVVIIGAVTVWYTHKKALGACLKTCWSRRNVPRQLVMVWTRQTPMTKWWRRKMRRATPASGDFSPGVLCPNCKAGTCLFGMKHGYKRQNRKSEPLTPECQTCQASEDTASSSGASGRMKE